MAVFGLEILSSPKRPQDLCLELLTTGYFSDAQVCCGQRTWKIHRNIVCHRSEWFKRALDGPFKESETRIINITEFHEHEVDYLLKFLYTGSIKLGQLAGEPTGAAVGQSMLFWRVGDFFLLEDLRKLALDFFKRTLHKASREIAGKSNLEDAAPLVESCVEFIPKLYGKATGRLFEAFRSTTLSFLVSGIHIFAKSRKFMDLLREVPEFASDWAVAVTKTVGSVELPPYPSDKCSGCGMTTWLLGLMKPDRVKWLQEHKIESLCEQCFRLRPIEIQDGNGGDNA